MKLEITRGFFDEIISGLVVFGGEATVTTVEKLYKAWDKALLEEASFWALTGEIEEQAELERERAEQRRQEEEGDDEIPF